MFFLNLILSIHCENHFNCFISNLLNFKRPFFWDQWKCWQIFGCRCEINSRTLDPWYCLIMALLTTIGKWNGFSPKSSYLLCDLNLYASAVINHQVIKLCNYLEIVVEPANKSFDADKKKVAWITTKTKLTSWFNSFLICFSAVWESVDDPQLPVCVSDCVGSVPGSPDHRAALSPQSRSVYTGWSYWPGNIDADTLTESLVGVFMSHPFKTVT